MRTAIIIPALKPNLTLVSLADELHAYDKSALIVIINDGSPSGYNAIFGQLAEKEGCAVICHAQNLGKGAALKTGIKYVSEKPEITAAVTADADGQHLAGDIAAVAEAAAKNTGSLILGTRDLSSPEVPFKSRWGNRITALVFRLGTGIKCPDTQTGLRGFSRELFSFMLSVAGTRYEYEMNTLISAAGKGVPIKSVPITTVYIEGNRSSHFNPLLDSARIYWNILKFGVASLASALFDLAVFTILSRLVFARTPSGIFFSTVIARFMSGGVNFTLNKRWSFGVRGGGLRQAAKYLTLFLCQMGLSWALVTALSRLPFDLTLLKIAADGALFILSYTIQKKYIFKK